MADNQMLAAILTVALCSTKPRATSKRIAAEQWRNVWHDYNKVNSVRVSCLIVGQRGPVREHLCNYCATRIFNGLSRRCTPTASANDGVSCGYADESITSRLLVIRPGSMPSV